MLFPPVFHPSGRLQDEVSHKMGKDQFSQPGRCSHHTSSLIKFSYCCSSLSMAGQPPELTSCETVLFDLSRLAAISCCVPPYNNPAITSACLAVMSRKIASR